LNAKEEGDAKKKKKKKKKKKNREMDTAKRAQRSDRSPWGRARLDNRATE